MASPPPPPEPSESASSVERLARQTVRWLIDLGNAAIRQPLAAVLVALALGGGTAATQIGGIARWIIVGVLALAVLSSLLVLWRAGATKRIGELETERARLAEALEDEQQANAELIERGREQAEELDAQAEKLDRHEEGERRAAIYADHRAEVMRGFARALDERWAVGAELVHLVESTSLSATAELFAGQLGRAGHKVRVELALVEPSEHGFRVTHASGPFTRDLKSNGECYARSLTTALARKADAHFVEDGCGLIEMQDGRFLVWFSEIPLTTPEQAALEEQAAIIELITVAFQALA